MRTDCIVESDVAEGSPWRSARSKAFKGGAELPAAGERQACLQDVHDINHPGVGLGLLVENCSREDVLLDEGCEDNGELVGRPNSDGSCGLREKRRGENRRRTSG